MTEFVPPDAPFAVTWEFALPLVLDPGATADVVVTYQPTAEGSFSDVIGISSDDPEGVDEVLVEGGATVVQRPEAVCSVSPNPVEPLIEEAIWSGELSTDPSGYAITQYDWELISVPPGSDQVLPTGLSEPTAAFTPEIPGTFVAQLVVTNEVGQTSDPCEVALESIPEDELWIEMHWTHEADDMDIHLVAPGGELLSERDCYYGTCTGTLDWGVEGDTTDNPAFLEDDIEGTGPEVVHLEAPEDGDFELYIHDYPSSVWEGANDVTVNVYVFGVLAWSDTRDFSAMGEDHYEHYATISFPSGVVTGQ